eukprot:scaffold1531_cov111-Isochrysis_galbana.AAC.7
MHQRGVGAPPPAPAAAPLPTACLARALTAHWTPSCRAGSVSSRSCTATHQGAAHDGRTSAASQEHDSGSAVRSGRIRADGGGGGTRGGRGSPNTVELGGARDATSAGAIPVPRRPEERPPPEKSMARRVGARWTTSHAGLAASCRARASISLGSSSAEARIEAYDWSPSIRSSSPSTASRSASASSDRKSPPASSSLSSAGGVSQSQPSPPPLASPGSTPTSRAATVLSRPLDNPPTARGGGSAACGTTAGLVGTTASSAHSRSARLRTAACHASPASPATPATGVWSIAAGGTNMQYTSGAGSAGSSLSGARTAATQSVAISPHTPSAYICNSQAIPRTYSRALAAAFELPEDTRAGAAASPSEAPAAAPSAAASGGAAHEASAVRRIASGATAASTAAARAADGSFPAASAALAAAETAALTAQMTRRSAARKRASADLRTGQTTAVPLKEPVARRAQYADQTTAADVPRICVHAGGGEGRSGARSGEKARTPVLAQSLSALPCFMARRGLFRGKHTPWAGNHYRGGSSAPLDRDPRPAQHEAGCRLCLRLPPHVDRHHVDLRCEQHSAAIPSPSTAGPAAAARDACHAAPRAASRSSASPSLDTDTTGRESRCCATAAAAVTSPDSPAGPVAAAALPAGRRRAGLRRPPASPAAPSTGYFRTLSGALLSTQTSRPAPCRAVGLPISCSAAPPLPPAVGWPARVRPPPPLLPRPLQPRSPSPPTTTAERTRSAGDAERERHISQESILSSPSPGISAPETKYRQGGMLAPAGDRGTPRRSASAEDQ